MWELDLLLNPKRPLSLSNCASQRVREHTLGWISSSAKPPVAYAMLQLAAGIDSPSGASQNGVSQARKQCGLIIDAMSGEGTIEIEAQTDNSFFVIGGDKDPSAALETSRRLANLKTDGSRRPPVDIVVWDAQRLPLRRGIADAYIADLPFAGGKKKKKHQQPHALGSASEASLDYKLVMAQAVQTLRPGGRAALLSADIKAMDHAARNMHWSVWCQSANAMNLGGLSAKLSVMKKRGPCGKDLSVWVCGDCTDLSEELLKIARAACVGFSLNEELGLDTNGTKPRPTCPGSSLIDRVELRHRYFDKENERSSHCYRFFFDDRITNHQAKTLERSIRFVIEEKPPGGVVQLR